MLWFQYETNNLNEIMSSITLVSSFQSVEWMILVAILFLYIGLIYYVVPYCKAVINDIIELKKKNLRKNLIERMVLQKNIEEEIEKELKI